MTPEWKIAHFSNISENYKNVWDLYIKYYVAFMVVNFTALAAVLEFFRGQASWPIAAAFFIMNGGSIGTAIGIARYSRGTKENHQQILNELSDSDAAKYPTSLPGSMAVYACIANIIGHVGFLICWCVVAWITPTLGLEKPEPGKAPPANVAPAGQATAL